MRPHSGSLTLLTVLRSKITASLAVLLSTGIVWAQEESVIAVQARLERSNSFHFNLGAATGLSQTNYKGGTLVGLGYQKRVNRIISAGASIAYTTFRTDYKNFMTGKYLDPLWSGTDKTTVPNNFYYTGSQAQYYLVNLSGGDLRQLNISIVGKINFVPIKSNTVASFYGLVAPGLVVSMLDRVESNINFFEHPTVDDYIQVNNTSFTTSESQSTVTGGINLSVGVEFFPTNVFSFYIQSGVAYSFAIPFVDTSLYQKRILEKEYYNPFVDYPMPKDFPLSKDKGFTSLNFQLGLAYNF